MITAYNTTDNNMFITKTEVSNLLKWKLLLQTYFRR